MCFTRSRGSHDDNVLFFFNEVQIEEVEDEGFIDGLGEREVERIQGFDHWELCLGDTGLNHSFLSCGDLLRG